MQTTLLTGLKADIKIEHDRPWNCQDIAGVSFLGAQVAQANVRIHSTLADENPYLVGLYIPTKFEHNRPSRCQYITRVLSWGIHEARAHVRFYSTPKQVNHLSMESLSYTFTH